MKGFFFLLTLQATLSKQITGAYKFGKEDFFYGTKFGAPANSNVKISFNTKFLITDQVQNQASK